MSSLYQRKSDGKWVCSVELPKGYSGKRKRKNLYADANLTKDQAEKAIKSQKIELEYQLEHNIYRDSGNMTIKDLVNEYYDHHKDIAITTQALNKMYIEKHIAPKKGGIGYVKIRDAVPVVFEDFYHDKMVGDSKLSPNTIIKLHSFLHGAFNFAVKNKMVLVNPLDSVKCPKKVKYKPKIPTDKEFLNLLESSKGTFDEVAIVLSGTLSLCRGEIFGLKWSNIDWKNHKITIEETYVHWNKNIRKEPKADSRNRTIHVPQFVLDVLDNYKKSLKEVGTYVCEEYKPDSYGKHFKKLAVKHGLDGITLHKLRHYNATIMMKLGIPDKIAAGRTGHSRVSTLQEIYQHVTDEADEIACEKIDDFFNIDNSHVAKNVAKGLTQ